MFQYFENLRKKPEAHRRKAVFLISLYSTLVIAIIWAILTSVRVAHMDFSFDTSDLHKKIPTIGETFKNLVNRMGDVFNSPSSTPE